MKTRPTTDRSTARSTESSGRRRLSALSTPARIGALLGALLTLSLVAGACTHRQPPPVLGDAPQWQLTNRDGRTVSSADLAGAPYVVDFIFTRCVAICPAMTAQMERVTRGLPEGSEIKLVSISLDPAHDTPEVLEEFAAKRHAPDSWLFLTGADQQRMFDLSQKGFKLAATLVPDDPTQPIVHSTRFVLVDGEGRIRGYYDSLEPEAMDKLRDDLRTLLD